jgi:SAM-dependent methyltransferase
MNTNPTTRFSDRATFYARSRPGYPAALLDFFRSAAGLTPADRIADIASGTGILTELLLKTANPVAAVEPNAPMRTIAEASLAAHPNFRSINGTAEATTLSDHSVELITVAQAFHWLDREKTRAEFARILTPGRFVCLIWNERRTGQTPLAVDYQRLISEFSADEFVEHHRTLTSGDRRPIRDFFAPRDHHVAEFDNHQILDLEGLTGRVLSSSHMPLEGHPLHAPMMNRLRQFFTRHQVGGTIPFDYDTRVYYGQLV